MAVEFDLKMSCKTCNNPHLFTVHYISMKSLKKADTTNQHWQYPTHSSPLSKMEQKRSWNQSLGKPRTLRSPWGYRNSALEWWPDSGNMLYLTMVHNAQCSFNQQLYNRMPGQADTQLLWMMRQKLQIFHRKALSCTIFAESSTEHARSIQFTKTWF